MNSRNVPMECCDHAGIVYAFQSIGGKRITMVQ